VAAVADRPAVDVSVVLPTYNEAGSIVRFLRELLEVLDRCAASSEVLVVDDDSPDGTAALVERELGHEPRAIVIHRTAARGLALSIREGLSRARGERLVVMDSDFNHDPQVIPTLLASLEFCDLASGSRFVPGGGMYSRTRQIGSLVMNRFIAAVLQTHVRDNLSGFFAIRRKHITPLLRDDVFRGYGDYYFRLLWWAKRSGYRVLEIPVVYRSREGGGSKTPLLRTAVRYAWNALRFRVWERGPASPLGNPAQPRY
jgi:dolichol-phosphate mannosyltransferase